MNRPAHTHGGQSLPDPTIKLTEGWHCLHINYQVDQAALNTVHEHQRAEGREQLAQILNPERDGAPQRLQTSILSGGRGDIALMIMDPDPLVIDQVKQEIRASRLGVALKPSYSFVSITEVSEYVPTIDQYKERLEREGCGPDDPSYSAKVGAYEQRLPMMNKQRMYPDFPAFPVCSFYPMN
ncbi:MAG: chlorite dismutase family protein, partial [Rhodopirellula sp.]|nr:chlorite dismutase family protein [Rhodopirellula sp.]